jgi:hypothetical protein
LTFFDFCLKTMAAAPENAGKTLKNRLAHGKARQQAQS